MPRAVLRRPSVNGSSDGAIYVVPRNGDALRMSRALRGVIFAASALLWLSGVTWLVLHYGFASRTAFGPLPNPFEPVVMRVHGVLAVCGVFLLGWITAAHLPGRWGSGRNRISGLVLAASAVVLVVSGYALYYVTAAPHDLAAIIHEGLGALAVLAALVHWWRRRVAR